jgi:thiol-disulfide isomerase/thioredoxin
MRNWLSIVPFVVVIGLVLAIVFSGGGLTPEPGPSLDNVAPEIDGVDLDGVNFKLSDYRGKVVLLSFSGEWCSACRVYHRYEKAVVEKYEGRPFVALGVNTDESPEIPKAAQASSQHPIRAWFDGQSDDAPGGAIARAWDVHVYPTIYLIDAKGVIRLKASGTRGRSTA